MVDYRTSKMKAQDAKLAQYKKTQSTIKGTSFKGTTSSRAIKTLAKVASEKKRSANEKASHKAINNLVKSSKKSGSGSKSSGSSGSSGGSGSSESSSGTSGGSGASGTGGVGGTGTAEAVEEVIENKYNDISGYFDPEEEEFIASTDTPTVRIFISRERVPETDEETGETKEDATEEVETVEEAARESQKIAEMYKKNKDITNNNSAVIKTSDQKILAMKAISDIDFNELDFGEDVNTEDVLKKLGLL